MSHSTGMASPVAQRALARVIRRDEGCWDWPGYHDKHGYSMLRHEGGNAAVHRLVYEALVGPIPSGLVLDHVCHAPGCVNPHHLRPVEVRLNVQNFTKMVNRDNTSGFRGVSFHKASGLWAAQVRHQGRRYNGGYFRTAEEAGEVARQLRLRLHSHNDMDRRNDDPDLED